MGAHMECLFEERGQAWQPLLKVAQSHDGQNKKDGLRGCFTGFNFNHALPRYDCSLLCISAKHTDRGQFKIQL